MTTTVISEYKFGKAVLEIVAIILVILCGSGIILFIFGVIKAILPLVHLGVLLMAPFPIIEIVVDVLWMLGVIEWEKY
jgi:hypothetical protein